LLYGGGKDDNGDEPGSLAGPYAAQHFDPVDLGELQVEQDEERRRCVTALDREEMLESFGAVAGHRDPVADVALLEGPDSQGLIVRVVLYEQDMPVAHMVSAVRRVK
jgi:hypothetical protein